MFIKCVSQQDTKHGGLTGNHVGGKCDGAQGMVADKKENINGTETLTPEKLSLQIPHMKTPQMMNM